MEPQSSLINRSIAFKCPNFFVRVQLCSITEPNHETRFDEGRLIDNICILTVGLELACNGSSCVGIFSNANIFNDIPPHKPRLQASSSSTVRILILSISFDLVHLVMPGYTVYLPTFSGSNA